MSATEFPVKSPWQDLIDVNDAVHSALPRANGGRDVYQFRLIMPNGSDSAIGLLSVVNAARKHGRGFSMMDMNLKYVIADQDGEVECLQFNRNDALGFDPCDSYARYFRDAFYPPYLKAKEHIGRYIIVGESQAPVFDTQLAQALERLE